MCLVNGVLGCLIEVGCVESGVGSGLCGALWCFVPGFMACVMFLCQV